MRKQRKKKKKHNTNLQQQKEKFQIHVFGVNTISVQQKGNLSVDSNQVTGKIKHLEGLQAVLTAMLKNASRKLLFTTASVFLTAFQI